AGPYLQSQRSYLFLTTPTWRADSSVLRLISSIGQEAVYRCSQFHYPPLFICFHEAESLPPGSRLTPYAGLLRRNSRNVGTAKSTYPRPVASITPAAKRRNLYCPP